MAVSTIRILVYDEYMKYTAYWSSKKYSAEWYIMVQKKSAAMVSLLFKIPGFSNLHWAPYAAIRVRGRNGHNLRHFFDAAQGSCDVALHPILQTSQEGLGWKTPQPQKES